MPKSYGSPKGSSSPKAGSDPGTTRAPGSASSAESAAMNVPKGGSGGGGMKNATVTECGSFMTKRMGRGGVTRNPMPGGTEYTKADSNKA